MTCKELRQPFICSSVLAAAVLDVRAGSSHSHCDQCMPCSICNVTLGYSFHSQASIPLGSTAASGSP